MLKTTHQIIDEIAGLYTLSTRSTREGIAGRMCAYYSPEGRVCAIGHMMVRPQNFAHTEFDITGILQMHTGNPLKDEYSGYSPLFYKDLQNFHDKQRYWTADGLSEKGKEYVTELKNKWPINTIPVSHAEMKVQMNSERVKQRVLKSDPKTSPNP